jgi:hypothetical protein
MNSGKHFPKTIYEVEIGISEGLKNIFLGEKRKIPFLRKTISLVIPEPTSQIHSSPSVRVTYLVVILVY